MIKKILPLGLAPVLSVFLATGIFAQEPEAPELLEKDFQFTFLCPPFSTNGAGNSKTLNKVSLNLFIGNAGAVDGVELATFLNSDNYFVKGFQGAGFANVVGRSVQGIQLAGFLNLCGAEATGFQGAGFLNISGGNTEGIQGAGFMNISGGDTRGFQGAGFLNVSGDDTRGCQGAGFGNVSGDSTFGAQLAGFFNVAGEYTRGVQMAGFLNLCGEGTINAQLSGFSNLCRNIDGVQMAGFLNVASKVKGTQLSGFINICDSIDGVPIGFISIVKKNGYRHFDFSVSETQYFNFAYRMGVPRFHNIYTVGKPSGPGNRWLLGFGVGTQAELREEFSLNIEALVNQEFWIADPKTGRLFHIDRLNLLNQVRALFVYRTNEHLEMYVGPSLNIAVAETNPDLGFYPWYEIGPNWDFRNRTYGNTGMTNVKIWFGITGGIRL